MATDWVLVTGASRGIGRAIALALAELRLHVVANSRAPSAAAEAALAEIAAAGGSGEALFADVADRAAVAAGLELVLERRGPPYAVIHGAGIARDGLLVWMKPEDWRAVLATNLDGFYHAVQPVLKAMIGARRGRIVALTSAAGSAGSAGQVNYSASKAGLHGAVMALARELAPRGITVNAVAPGWIATDMTATLDADRIRASIPAGRLGTPREVAAVVRFLLQPDASYVTGQIIGVNGGLVT